MGSRLVSLNSNMPGKRNSSPTELGRKSSRKYAHPLLHPCSVPNRLRLASLILIIVAGTLAGAVSCASPPGYAALVRKVAPSVVTVLVEQERIGAADRAAA